MANTNVNSTQTMAGRKKSSAELNAEIAAAQAKFKGEKKVKVSIPKVLGAQLSKTLFVGVNGVAVNVPVDGEEYELPETLANHVKQYLKELK